MPERLQKILARQGLGSRREIEGWIEQGRVKLNGKPAKLGDQATEQDKIQIDGRKIFFKIQQIKTRVMIYNKPEGIICTRQDPEGRPTVFEQNPVLRSKKWIVVGRLDINSSGLLMFTNNGELANRLMHPKYELQRVYAVRVFGELNEQHIKNLKSGVKLEDGLAKFETISHQGGTGKNHWYHVSIGEGRQREVRRLIESQGLTVSRLMRIAYGPLQLPPYFKAGQFKELSFDEVKELMKTVGLET